MINGKVGNFTLISAGSNNNDTKKVCYTYTVTKGVLIERDKCNYSSLCNLFVIECKKINKY